MFKDNIIIPYREQRFSCVKADIVHPLTRLKSSSSCLLNNNNIILTHWGRVDQCVHRGKKYTPILVRRTNPLNLRFAKYRASNICAIWNNSTKLREGCI